MNNIYRPRQGEKFTVTSEALLGLLLLVAFFQIALCLGAGFQLIPPVAHVPSVGQISSLDTNTFLFDTARAASDGKSSGFQSVITHG